MARATSPAGSQPYGIRRVCQAWGVPRSSFYAAQAPTPDSAIPACPPTRRGPKPFVSDEALLAAIKRDLETSPWTGEGHRKVWARLRVRDGIRVSRKRLLRLMREHALLSPHRPRRKDEDSHQRQIITTAPNIMWAIDATQLTTVQHGKVWIFGVAEHWNAEFLGWHVTKRGTRFEATQALAMAVRQQFGHLSAGAARGLALRHDHGSNFMAEHFQKQARFCVIERFFRTLKEQAIHGRVFQTIDEVRDAVRDFAARYNAEWLIEKNGYLSPLDARTARLDTTFRRAA
jgi:transposase InsO family protein